MHNHIKIDDKRVLCTNIIALRGWSPKNRGFIIHLRQGFLTRGELPPLTLGENGRAPEGEWKA